MKPSRRTVLHAVASAAATVVLAGCQVRPLYDRQATLGAPEIPTALAQIAIDPPADRTTQLVRNELVFGLGIGGETLDPVYRLALRAESVVRSLAVQGTGTAIARSVAVTAEYQLIPLGERDVLATNAVTATASFDVAEQRFSNQRAERDAVERAAREVAQIIQAQLSVALAGLS
ncbi:MAG: LPS assembly lipoprotein LptE [Pseudomonadota bacterium]